jgi:toxin HigB-1
MPFTPIFEHARHSNGGGKPDSIGNKLVEQICSRRITRPPVSSREPTRISDTTTFCAHFDKHRLSPYNRWVIRSFKHRGLKRLYEHGDRSGIRPDLLETVERILSVLDDAGTPQALDLPRYRLHPLKGDLQGYWSVTVRANWRIVFGFDGTDAVDVELIDYH